REVAKRKLKYGTRNRDLAMAELSPPVWGLGQPRATAISGINAEEGGGKRKTASSNGRRSTPRSAWRRRTRYSRKSGSFGSSIAGTSCRSAMISLAHAFHLRMASSLFGGRIASAFSK